jgi:hypothetical protein
VVFLFCFLGWAKQALYHLSHTSSPVCSGYFDFIFLVVLGFKLRNSCLNHFTCLKQGVWLLWLFWRWDLLHYLPGLVLDCDPPNLSLPSSEDYRPEPPAPCLLQYSCISKLLKIKPIFSKEGIQIQDLK